MSVFPDGCMIQGHNGEHEVKIKGKWYSCINDIDFHKAIVSEENQKARQSNETWIPDPELYKKSLTDDEREFFDKIIEDVRELI